MSPLRLDLRGLPAPEPFVRATEALRSLPLGTCLELRLPCEPFPLYAVLDDQGFSRAGRPLDDGGFEVIAWRKGDSEAERIARERRP